MQTKTVICFCKHPEPGFVKTRLSANLGEEFTAELYKKILEHILTNICVENFDIALYCYPDSDHPFFKYCQNKYTLTLHKQMGKDIGMRMYNAIRQHLKYDTPVVLIGSDCPQLDLTYINRAFTELETGHDIVLGPAVDGGYVLIGTNKIHVSIFSGINWSTNKVLKDTEEKINSLGWSTTCLSSVRDVDELTDYNYFSAQKEYAHIFSK